MKWQQQVSSWYEWSLTICLSIITNNKSDGLFYSSTLKDTLKNADFSVLKPYIPGTPEKFATFLDKVMGYA